MTLNLPYGACVLSKFASFIPVPVQSQGKVASKTQSHRRDLKCLGVVISKVLKFHAWLISFLNIHEV